MSWLSRWGIKNMQKWGVNNEKRKNEIVSKLQTIYSCAKLKPHECEWILQTIDYIREQRND